MDPTVLTIVVSLVAVVFAGVEIAKHIREGHAVTPALVLETLAEAQPKAAELTEVALTGARAAEQLYHTGKLPRDERMAFALSYARWWFPDLNDEKLIVAIESAVLVINTVVEALPKKAK